jgi:hypothetical protein
MYKLMYYNLYHVSDLREIKCIKFVRNKFVLVLVQINLIQFENSNYIRSI